MLKNVKKISILLLTSIFLFSSVEADWITKKSDKSKEVIKEEKKQKSKWIKLKKKEIKKNKEDYKKKEKNISNEVKSWITKKVKKDKFLVINSLPNSQIYFTAQATDGRIFYGYINDDKKSDKITFNGNSIYKISKGKGYIQNSKSICNIATERGIIANTIIGFVSGECSDKTKFTGQYSQKSKSGSAETDQKIKINFNFNENLESTKTEIAKLKKIKDNNDFAFRSTPRISPEIILNPTGKYYALLIGNSNYAHWSSLKSPINDVNQIGKILKNDYNFSKVITVRDSNRENIFSALENINSITTDKDYVLIYYSGHGSKVKTSVKTEAYWIPVDGKKKFDSNWVNIKDVENYLQDNQAYHMAVMVDSCFFPNLTKGGSKNEVDVNKNLYSKLFNKKSRVILAAGLNEEVADTVGTNSISVFAKTFINALKNNTSIIPLRNIANDIINAHVSMDQTPDRRTYKNWGHNGGSFMFVKKN
jgi:hypothetical protein